MSGPLRTISQPEFMNKSFYSKSELSPCGRFLLSGASIADAFIWDLDSSGAQSTPVYRLSSHDKEVSCVAWNQSDPGLLATCSDDSTVRIWRADYGQKNSPILQQTQYSKITEHQVIIRYPLVSNDFSQNITPPLSPINGKNLNNQRSTSKINHFFSPSKLCTTSSTNSTSDTNKENCK